MSEWASQYDKTPLREQSVSRFPIALVFTASDIRDIVTDFDEDGNEVAPFADMTDDEIDLVRIKFDKGGYRDPIMEKCWTAIENAAREVVEHRDKIR